MDVVTIPHLALRSARRFGDRTAIAATGSSPLSYADLARQMTAAARAFMAAGIVCGDRVAIWAPNVERWIIAALGAQAAGAVLVPLNTRYKGAEAAYIMRASGVRLLLTVSRFLDNAYPAMIADEDVPSLERLILLDGEQEAEGWEAFLDRGRAFGAEAADARLASLTSDDVSDILFTSGTTGRPKGVITTHGQNLAVYDAYSAELGWSEDDRLLAINPFFHSFGYKAGWVCSIMRGSTLYPMDMFDPRAALDRIEAERITLMPGPPTIFQSLLALPLEGRDLSSLRLAVTGATIVPATLVRAMREELCYDHVVTAYGLTEMCGVVSMCSMDDDIETIAGTSGRPIPGVEIKVVGPQGEPFPAGSVGEILVRGPNVMRGYLDDPGATAEAVDPEGWLRTGDIGFVRADGCLRITDRSKDVYICGGFNVYPAEVEQALAAHPDIAEAAVVGAPDERLGEVGHAFLVLKPGSRMSGEAGRRALLEWARESMANFKVPRNVDFVEHLPRNASGKIEKFKLRQERT